MIPHATSRLVIRDLRVRFATAGGELCAVNGADLDVRSGECLGLVGESGSGKSQLVLAVLGLLSASGRVSGSAHFNGVDLLACPAATLNRIRGRDIGMVFQDPMTSLTPHLRVGDQIGEVLRFHQGMQGDEAVARSRALLERVRMADATRRLRQYPHELSGGMLQRVMLAIALACEPKLLVADEPTSALDVTVQAELLDLFHELRRDLKLGILLITHDLGVVADLAERIAVMYAGRIVEEAAATQLLESPRHPYTAALLSSTPRLSDPLDRELATVAGQPPDPYLPIAGCAFAPRCRGATSRCVTEWPQSSHEAAQVRSFACHYPLGEGQPGQAQGIRSPSA